MCLIIHKPAGIPIPADLLAAAAAHNREGWGVMGFDEHGELLLERHTHVHLPELVATEKALRDHEYVLHLRKQTRGGSGADNVHPFKVIDGVWLMHNGTVNLAMHAPGKSDTWHLVADVLRPLEQAYSGVLSHPAFLQIVEHGLRAENKLALLDQRKRCIVIVNRSHGVEIDGLWLSNTRWLDRRLFPLAHPLQPQELQLNAQQLTFV